MAARSRWIGRSVILAFGVGLAGVFGVVAVGDTASALAATEPLVRSVLSVAAGASWLKLVGLAALFASQAAAFRGWSTFMFPFTPIFGGGGPGGGLRRARRQIDGVEPFAPEDLPRLRSLAGYRVELVRTSNNPLARLGSVGLLLFLAGIVLDPPDDVSYFPGIALALQVLGVVAALPVLVSLILVRAGTDEKAEAFLRATAQPLSPDPTTWTR